jgi:hypothetical protein
MRNGGRRRRVVKLGMKTITSVMVAFALSIFASNGFAMIRSPYPQKATAPDTIIINGDDRHNSVRSTVRVSK